MDLDGVRKRERTETALNGNGGFKKSKPEMDSLSTGLGSKSRPCTKFFSTSGCPFGEGCHFAHYVPGGFKAISQMIGPALPPGIRNPAPPQSFPDGVSPPAVKTRLCNKFNSAEGCRFGDKCYYAHGEWELGRPNPPQDHGGVGPMQQPRMGGGWNMPPPPPNHGPAASFGASATAKISVDASLAGPIIGKNGVNSKNICRMTGARLSIKEHESDPNLKNIELEGTFDQINLASSMVRELIANVGAASANNAMKQHQHQQHHHASGMQQSSGSANNFKTKLCANFTKGTCTFRERCHFAHGESELRKPGI
ncbi:zinc finger CCCH domain-containing protein 14-like [Benincasa hispida]|uniref:zinc finger CCCH domain-containing protein 14-like n=1 Tax=Benincasa hispida TaxID=102211 RepID=UPI0019007212|nr:zinc finger CCCH domain-containing protein 14-like [Benincasa hispida]